MRVTVAGSSCSIPRPSRACSSYIVDDGSSTIVFDFGTGAFANVRSHYAYESLGAIVISHMHADHFIDLIPLRYALRYGNHDNRRKIPLYLPPDGERILRDLTDVFTGEGGDFLSDVFTIAMYDPSTPLRIGESTVSFAPTRHYIRGFALRAERDGTSVTYSADTAPDDEVVALARDTDIFLCEATLAQSDGHSEVRGHCSAREAGEMAAAAHARRLVLTHYDGETPVDRLLDDAREAFGEHVCVTDDHDVIEISVVRS